ncbi:MAG: MoaD/ThiS family protein [Anaerolineales bacterium]|nr:MoaD/ThiS family protein [Anaerolineales bacterium]
MAKQLPGDHHPEGKRITVEVALYGPLAKYGGGVHVAQSRIDLDAGAQMRDLLEHLKIPAEERGFTFINAVLCAVPGLQADLDLSLQDGDHIGIFSTTHMWPYQYRDGIRMTETLKEAMKEQGPMHHSYN